MRQYLDIVDNVLSKGKYKGNRTGIRTLVLPNQHFSHDMSEGFPLLTTKKMPLRTIAVELEGFIKGITSKGWYQERKCKIWDEWANPRVVDERLYSCGRGMTPILSGFENAKFKESVRKKYQAETDDLGPIYGYQWRRFGEAYDEEDDGQIKGYDQFKELVDKLHNNPDDRRLVVSAWNPHQISRMALPPCHLLWVCTHVDGELSLHWTQRSCDSACGTPFNIASYALLLTLLCKEANMKPGNLSAMFCDCHIYENHIEGLKKQLTRTTQPLADIDITNWTNIFEWTHQDLKLNNYDCCDKIQFDVAV